MLTGKYGIGGTLMALALLAPPNAAAAVDWQFWSTCWQDFDAGGGRFCGLRSRACATAGATDNDRVHCASSDYGSQIPPSYLGPQPRSTAIALDSAGYVFLVDENNQIWHEEGTGWVQLGVQSPMGCISKLVAAGSLGSGTTTLLALGCGASAHQAYKYSAGAWTLMSRDALDISVANWGTADQAIWGHNPFILLQASNRALWYTRDEGIGGFARALASATVTESWISSGTQYQVTHKPVLIGGRSGFFGDYTSCPSIGGVPPFGEWQFYAYKAPPALPFPSGTYGGTLNSPCSTLHIPPGSFDGNDPSAWVTKVVTGHRGPNLFEGSWILTNTARVYALRAVN